MISRIVNLGGTVVVGSTYEPVMDWRSFGGFWSLDRMLFWAQVAADGPSARCIIETSQANRIPDSSFSEFDVTPTAQGSYVLSVDAVRYEFRLSAKSLTADPATVIWGMCGYYLTR